MVVTGDDQEAVNKSAEQLANSFWEARNQFEFVAPVGSLDESLEQAINSDTRPYIISDMGVTHYTSYIYRITFYNIIYKFLNPFFSS